MLELSLDPLQNLWETGDTSHMLPDHKMRTTDAYVCVHMYAITYRTGTCKHMPAEHVTCRSM